MRNALILASLLVLSGCGWVGEERTYFMKRDLDRLFSPEWVKDAGENLGVNDLFPSSYRKEQQAEQRICSHPNGQNRVVVQDGVSDRLDYRRCALSPYAMDGGSRMGIRPDGHGSVVR